MDFTHLLDAYSVGYWMYAPDAITEEAYVLSWLNTTLYPTMNDFVHDLLSIYTHLVNFNVQSFGPGGWRADFPVEPIPGDNSPTVPNNCALDFVVGEPSGRRGGRSIQHFVGLPVDATDDGVHLSNSYYSLAQSRGGSLFNGALSPFSAFLGGYVATLSRVFEGAPRSSALLLPAQTYGPSRRMGTMRRRMRT